MPLSDAAIAFARKRNVPSELVTADWDPIELWIKERSFWMAGVEDARILQAFRDEIDAIQRGESGGTESMGRLTDFLEKIGYKPPMGTAGTIKDLRTIDRMAVAIDTNVDMARGFGRYQRLLKSVKSFPALSFERRYPREEHRLWADRWQKAYEATADVPGATPSSGDHEKPGAAIIGHPIWIALSRFGQPYAPFDWGSGMDVVPIKRNAAKEMGLLDTEAARQMVDAPKVVSFNHDLEANPEVRDRLLRAALSDRLGGLAEWDGDVLRHTDPNGSTPTTPDKLASVWRNLPPGIDRLQMIALRRHMTGETLTPTDERMLEMLRERIGNEFDLQRLWELVKDD